MSTHSCESTDKIPAGRTLLALLLAELNREMEAGGGVTQGEALVKTMVKEALAGDIRMISGILKEMDNQDAQAPGANGGQTEDWLALFAFYGKYKKLIEAEIRRLKKIDADYWSFGWFKCSLKDAPWYGDFYPSGK